MNVNALNQKKRFQVPHACTNCRKMHTGCDLERPCKRCLQHGLESSCSDIPRKRRMLKKKEKLELQLVSHPRPSLPLIEDAAGTHSTEIVPFYAPSGVSIEEIIEPENTVEIVELDADVSTILPEVPLIDNKTWEKPETDTWEFSLPEDVSTWSDMKDLKLDTIPSNWGNLKSISDQLSLFNQVPILADVVEAVPAEVIIAPTKVAHTPQVAQLSQPGLSNVSNIELNFLIQQISELKESNKDLENRLIQVSSELLESKVKPSWHSFGFTTGIGFSVWQTASMEDYKLIECNSTFSEMSGYSISVLEHGFSFKKLIVGVDPKNAPLAPINTHLITATGELKEITILLNQIPDTQNYVLQILK